MTSTVARPDDLTTVLAPHLVRITSGPELEAIADDLAARFVVFTRPTLVITEERKPGNNYTEQCINGVASYANSAPDYYADEAPARWAEAVEAVTEALNIQAVHEYFQDAPARAVAEKEARWAERRREVAAAFWPNLGAEAYAQLGDGGQQAVDRIIELEHAQS